MALDFRFRGRAVASASDLCGGPEHPQEGQQFRHRRQSERWAEFEQWRTGGSSRSAADLLIVQAPEVRPGPVTSRFPQGSKLIRVAPSALSPRNLTADFFAAADPHTSFDGLRVLFAGKKAADLTWQVWEMNIDGSGARQITHCPDDCLKPAYLPRGEIAYTAIASEQPSGSLHGLPGGRHATFAPPPPLSWAQVLQIWVCKFDGSDARQITFGPGDFQVETVLKNGVILATARSPLLPSNGLPADRELYTLRPDGTALATLRCDHQHPAIRSQAQELDDGSVVFVKTSLASSSVGGDLAWIRRGALHNSPLTAPPILASSPQPVAEDKLLVARESPTSPTSAKKLTLYAFDAGAGKFEAPDLRRPQALDGRGRAGRGPRTSALVLEHAESRASSGLFHLPRQLQAEGRSPRQDRRKARRRFGSYARSRNPEGKRAG